MSIPTETKLYDLVKGFYAAMLVTRGAQGALRGRPMAVAEVDFQGSLWFLTQQGAPKVDEIEHNFQVCVTMQSASQFVSITGTAEAVQDVARVKKLWNASWKTWFPKGPDDPDLILLKVEGDTGEYWDNAGTSGLKYLLKAGQAYLSGTKPGVAGDPDIHGKVTL